MRIKADRPWVEGGTGARALPIFTLRVPPFPPRQIVRDKNKKKGKKCKLKMKRKKGKTFVKLKFLLPLLCVKDHLLLQNKIFGNFYFYPVL